MSEIYTCAECGHLHFLGSTKGYEPCPIEGCSCQGQDWAQDDLTPRPGHVVAVDTIPDCDYCGQCEADWDVPTTLGPWAFLCDRCAFSIARYPGKTGVGIGQRLVLREPSEG